MTDHESIDVSTEEPARDEPVSKFSGRPDVLHSIMFAARLSPLLGDKAEVLELFDELASACKSSEGLTGVVLVYPYHVVAILETSMKNILYICRKLQAFEIVYDKYLAAKKLADETTSRNPMKMNATYFKLGPVVKTTILSICYDIGKHYFRYLEKLVLDVEPSNLDTNGQNESDEKRLIDLIRQLTRLSAYLVYEPMKDVEDFVPEMFRIRMDKILSNLRTDVPDLVPQQVTIGHFVDRSKFEGIIPIKEYLEYYDVPYSTVLNYETTWPVFNPTFYYV